MICIFSRVHIENFPGGDNQRNLDSFDGGLMVKGVTKFHICHLGVRGRLECVCVCRVSYRILSFRRGGTLK